MMVVTQLLNSRKYIFFDGALGTMLQQHGLEPGKKPDLMNITAPETVEMIHRMYIEAGSDIICANTFGATALGLKGTGYTTQQVVTAAINAARRAVSSASVKAAKPPLVALDIGPTGHMLEPFGELSFDDAYEQYREMAIAGEKAGADLAVCETMSDCGELKAAITAVRDSTNLPVFATMTFEKSGRTFMGCTPAMFVETAEECGAAAIGLNCSLEPQEMFETAGCITEATKLPLIIKPNAGLPDPVSGKYSVAAQEFTRQMLEFKQLGVKIIGGCCGTTPEYIKMLKEAFI